MGNRFTTLEAYKKLLDLSQIPIDLTKENTLTPERIKEMQAFSCGLKMLFSTERVCNKTLDALANLSKESNAVHLMKKMQEGDKINQIEGFDSENRSVLHTAMRDVFEKKADRSDSAKEAAIKAQEQIDKLKGFLERINSENRFTDLIQIGIGGSDLGPKALYLSLLPYRKEGRKAHFVSNVDPDDIASTLKMVDLSKTLVVIVSKSGTTLETKTNESLIQKAFIEKGLDPSKHCIAVTGKNSPMDDSSKYLESFYIWDYVGGRFSATSMVGGVTLSFVYGLEIFLELLKGAHEMDKAALEEDVSKNLPLLGALIGIWNHNFLNIPTIAQVPYSQALVRFPAHLQQCDMESNGKSITKEGKRITDYQTGPILWGEVGTNGQHSFFQLLHQGTQIAALEMIGFSNSQYEYDALVDKTSSQEKLLSNLFAQSIALATGKVDNNPNKNFEGNRPNHILLAKKLTPKILGALLAYYEHKIAFQGFIWGINSFDQEGVQYGKVLANKILEVYRDKREGQKAQYPIGQAFIEELESLRE